MKETLAFKLILIGRTVVHWSHVECTIDLLNQSIGFLETPTEKFPAAFKNKVRFFRTAFRNDPLLAHLRSDAESIGTELIRVGQLRHDAVHGMARNLSDQKDGIKFIRYTYPKGAQWQPPMRSTVNFSTADMNRLISDMEAVHVRLTTLADDLLDVVSNHVDYKRRQLARAKGH